MSFDNCPPCLMAKELKISLDEKPTYCRACYQRERTENAKLREALEEIRDLEKEPCRRCEGNGRLWANGKAHLPSEPADTIPCGDCGGSGYILPDDAQDIAEQALEEQRTNGKS